MNFITIAVGLSVFISSISLPEGFLLGKNNVGELQLKGPKGTVIVEPKILGFGYNKNYFIACIKNVNPQMDLKRYVIVNFSSGHSVDTANMNNWIYFKKELPELKEVKINAIDGETCP